MKETYRQRLHNMHVILGGLEVSDRRGKALEPQDGFQELLGLTRLARARQYTMFLVGNGASASMASHIAADLCKNAKLSTEVFSDASLLTAVANDVGSDHLFAVPLRRRGRKGDLLVAISSSGKSKNIMKAVKTARKIGMKIISFSAMNAGNPLRKEGDLNFYIRAETYGLAESAHAVLLHYWVDMVS